MGYHPAAVALRLSEGADARQGPLEAGAPSTAAEIRDVAEGGARLAHGVQPITSVQT